MLVKTLTNYLPTIYLKRIKAMFIFSGLKGQLDQIFKTKLFSKPKLPNLVFPAISFYQLNVESNKFKLIEF